MVFGLLDSELAILLGLHVSLGGLLEPLGELRFLLQVELMASLHNSTSVFGRFLGSLDGRLNSSGSERLSSL